MPSKRPTRRRGRAPHADDSDDDDIERAAQTDSDDDSLPSSDSDSEDSDSETEPVSRHLTPNTSHSPDTDEKPANINPFFAVASTPAAWADIVDEAAGLPVINFGEVVPEETEQEQEEADQPVASTSRHSSAPPPSGPLRASQSARQAYQHRLDSDPSFVPVVGEFWGHDDRLLDKDLRSLSGWWRGRWQGRGRGRGGPFPPRGRGRGGAFAANPSMQQHPQPGPDAADESPVDRTWTHDGFEEMRRRETVPRPGRGAAPNAFRGAPAFRARGGHPGRGMPGRTWFAMKPEHMWTKQHDAFLYFDPALKARPGHPPGLRVRLPGGSPTVIRAIPRPYRPAKLPSKVSAVEIEYVVRLPRVRPGKERAAPPPVNPQSKPEQDAAFTVKMPAVASTSPSTSQPTADAVAAALQPDADGWVRPDPGLLAAVSSPPSGPAPALSLSPPPPSGPPPPGFYPFAPPGPPPLGFPIGVAFPQGPPPTFAPFAPTPPPPGFSPVPPGFALPPHAHTPPPGFNTHTPPAGFAGTPPPGFASLPPGVGLDARGMPFEIASGRPVYIQAPVFAPYMNGHHPSHSHSHSMSIGGGHAHSMSMGGGQHAHSISIGGPDPNLFAFARPARVEIRAPGAGVVGPHSHHSSHSSHHPSPLAQAAPLSPLSPGSAPQHKPSPLSPPHKASPLSPRGEKDKKLQLRTGAAAFVPSHATSASVALANGYEHPHANGANGAANGYDSPVHPNGGNPYDSQNGYEAQNGLNPYEQQPNGGYVPTQYYFPYYGGAPAQQEPPPPMGTVYYS
ncbi:hypothetical protein C8R43DRAFT_1028816 [Mycena crocata]|nr:hypothetical protein C8R43DRAFT_1028816 [Mycena crocata]